MRFRVLGQLRVGPQTPSAAKMCTLLGTLLVSANEVVAADSLVDELWGDDPPRTFTTTLHVYISHLRKLLADGMSDEGGRDRIETRLPGYLIRMYPEELDLHRFEALHARGQESYARGDFTAAGRALQEALGLWTGPVLDGVPRGRRLEAAADRLELMRLEAGEQRIAAELWLGRHQQLVGELTVLAREHPIRETLHAHLIVALYRSHRQSEALAVYDTVRRSLAEELGTDPGAALQELHQRVLRSEPVLHFEQCQVGWESVTLSGAAAPVVRLPPAARHLAGRQEQLKTAEALLRTAAEAPSAHAVNIVGAVGVGKTCFGVELAHRTADLFPDGQVLVDLRGSADDPLDTRAAALRLLRLLRPGPEAPPPDHGADTDELADALHVALSGRRLLLVLDDVGAGVDVRALVSAASAGTVLLTSRKPVAAGTGSRVLALEALRPEESVDLLAAAAGHRITDDPSAATAVARLCGHLPLALHAAAAVLTAHPHWPAGKLADRLADESTRVEVLTTGDHRLRDRLLADCLRLDPAARRAFRLLVLAPGADFAPWSAAALLGVPQVRAERIVEQLVRARLLRVASAAGEPVRYAYDELFRALAAEPDAEADPEAAGAATRRLCAGYLTLARYAGARLVPGRSPIPLDATDGADGADGADGPDGLYAGARLTPGRSPSPVDAADGQAADVASDPATHGASDMATDVAADPDWMDPEHPVGDAPLRWFQEEGAALAEAVRRAHAAGWWRTVCALAEAVRGYAEVSGAWERWEDTAELALDAAGRSGDAGAEARALCGLGALAWQRRQFEQARALYERAVRRAKDAGAGAVEARALIGLADAASGHGRLAEARRLYGKASLLCRTAGDLRGLSDALRGLALTELRAGEPHAALRTFAECGGVARELGDRRWSEYARRVEEGIRRGLAEDAPFDDEPLEVRPGVWAMNRPVVRDPR